MAARFIRAVPAVVLQIIFGITLGAGLFSLTGKDFGIELLANVGLFAIFFGVELDFDLTAHELTSSTPVRSAVAGVSASMLLVFLATLALGYSASSSFLVGLATVSTSVSVSVYSYLTIGPLSHLEAKVAVMAGLFDDLLGLIALSVLSSLLLGSLKGLISLAVSLIVVPVSYVLKRRLTGRSFRLHPAYRYGLTVVVTIVLGRFVVKVWLDAGHRRLCGRGVFGANPDQGRSANSHQGGWHDWRVLHGVVGTSGSAGPWYLAGGGAWSGCSICRQDSCQVGGGASNRRTGQRQGALLVLNGATG